MTVSNGQLSSSSPWFLDLNGVELTLPVSRRAAVAVLGFGGRFGDGKIALPISFEVIAKGADRNIDCLQIR